MTFYKKLIIFGRNKLENSLHHIKMGIKKSKISKRTKSSRQPRMLSLPVEISMIIISKMSRDEIPKTFILCKQFNFRHDPYFWKMITGKKLIQNSRGLIPKKELRQLLYEHPRLYYGNRRNGMRDIKLRIGDVIVYPGDRHIQTKYGICVNKKDRIMEEFKYILEERDLFEPSYWTHCVAEDGSVVNLLEKI